MPAVVVSGWGWPGKTSAPHSRQLPANLFQPLSFPFLSFIRFQVQVRVQIQVHFSGLGPGPLTRCQSGSTSRSRFRSNVGLRKFFGSCIAPHPFQLFFFPFLHLSSSGFSPSLFRVWVQIQFPVVLVPLTPLLSETHSNMYPFLFPGILVQSSSSLPNESWNLTIFSPLISFSLLPCFPHHPGHPRNCTLT